MACVFILLYLFFPVILSSFYDFISPYTIKVIVVPRRLRTKVVQLPLIVTLARLATGKFDRRMPLLNERESCERFIVAKPFKMPILFQFPASFLCLNSKLVN